MTTKKKTGSESEKNATWTEIASVPIRRGVSKDGDAPLTLTQSVGSGALRNGRRFDVLLGMTDGSLIIYLDPVSARAGTSRGCT